MVYNEEAFIRDLAMTALELGEGMDEAFDSRGIRHVLQGNILVCRVNINGKATSICDEDVETIKHYLKAVDYVRDGVIDVE